uniref:Uncharacterized protein n=1 Tax=Arundo donax TaxID=35708 RepID=A0A0A9CD32_ARUDO
MAQIKYKCLGNLAVRKYTVPCERAWDQLVTRASVAPTSSRGPGFDL